MKLTNAMRDVFVRQVMADVPKVDYGEQVRKVVTETSLGMLPAPVLKLWRDEKLKGHVNTVNVNFHSKHGLPDDAYVSAMVPGLSGAEILAQCADKVRAIGEVWCIQSQRHSELHDSIRAAARSVTTRKTLAEMLPEFEKYLPADTPAANRSLPVVANVVANFVKAGWPKGGKSAKA